MRMMRMMRMIVYTFNINQYDEDLYFVHRLK